MPAERRLGELYLRGTATLQDFGKAQDWLHKAANAGDAKALEQLGHIYALGLGVAQDRSQAYARYENATLHGDGLAQIMRRSAETHVAGGDRERRTSRQGCRSKHQARQATFQRIAHGDNEVLETKL